jgi:hypothetical protein
MTLLYDLWPNICLQKLVKLGARLRADTITHLRQILKPGTEMTPKDKRTL